ncbi:hypothetical protein C4K04_5979 [Pseudomonas chlororaphis]|uniref:Uncharacterized protein n=1 Tax=Pseudomonas chlororaphis TaxID=587753 RepID=A0A3G7TWW9_9PSED|nr:hypothetical protein C4K04_5979 [Pseudomonas chlororaphis]
MPQRALHNVGSMSAKAQSQPWKPCQQGSEPLIGTIPAASDGMYW